MEDKILGFEEYFSLTIQRHDYFQHHLNSFYVCCREKLYSSAYFHLHILYMAFVYTHILRIAKKKETEFKLRKAEFSRRDRRLMKKLDSPFAFGSISEKAIFRFFNILRFDDDAIEKISDVVKKRNNRFHAKGIVHFEDADAFEEEFDLYLWNMIIIIKNQAAFLKEIYALKVEDFKGKFTVNEDEIEKGFADDEDLFSVLELKLLAVGKNDIVSKFIKKEYKDIIYPYPSDFDKKL